jgi:hypothetical protein
LSSASPWMMSSGRMTDWTARCGSSRRELN